MADDDSKGSPTLPPPPQQQPANMPSIQTRGQYIKDLSFENPSAPAAILSQGANPSFAVNISVGAKKQGTDNYAVEMTLNAKAERDGSVLFNVELVYGGLFSLRNVPENTVAPVLMVECPRLLFPFARQVLASLTQQGGFPPLVLEPVDFAALYRQNMAAQAGGANKLAEGGRPN